MLCHANTFSFTRGALWHYPLFVGSSFNLVFIILSVWNMKSKETERKREKKREVGWGWNRETCCISNCCIFNKTHSNHTQHLKDKTKKGTQTNTAFSVCVRQRMFLKTRVIDCYNAPSEAGKDPRCVAIHSSTRVPKTRGHTSWKKMPPCRAWTCCWFFKVACWWSKTVGAIGWYFKVK